MIPQINIRKSIRKYKNQPIEPEKITQMLESARLAPSGNNTQPWHFIVITAEDIKKNLAVTSRNQVWMLSAPIFIACVADIRARIKDSSELIINETSPQKEVKLVIRDTTIAIEHLVLEACNLGLGTCWVADFTQEQIRPILNVPSDKYVVCILTVGYADETPQARPRKSLPDIVHYDTW